MLGIIVAQALRKKRKITITTSATVNSSVNSISLTEARIVVVRLKLVPSVTVGGMEARNSGSNAHDAVHGLNNVGAGLPANAHGHGGFAVRVSGVAEIFDSLGHFRNIAQPDRSPISDRQQSKVNIARV